MEAAINRAAARISFSPLMLVKRELDSTQMSTGMLRMRTSVMELGRFTCWGPQSRRVGLVRLCSSRKGEATRGYLRGIPSSRKGGEKWGTPEVLRSVLRRVFVGGRLMGDDLILNLLVGGS